MAGALTWLLVATWAAGAVVTALFIGGVREDNATVKWWAVVLAVVLTVVPSVPLLNWLRPAVDSLLYSHPEDTRVLVAQFGRQVHDQFQDLAEDSDERSLQTTLVGQMATQIAHRLRLPYVAIVAPGAAPPPGPSGEPPPADRLVRVPLTFAGGDVATLLVLPRHRDAALPATDRALLEDLAAQIGITLHAVQVTEEVRASRAAVITAREEERRRIRRDLHDGLGPALASLRLQLAAVEQLIPERPQEAAEAVKRLRSDVRDTSAQVRGLVYDLRPPMLDELGLLDAVRARVQALEGVDVTIDVVEPMPDLPAAVEVALYRIASEAIANVGRHAAAAHAWLRIELDDATLRFELEDDGHGLPEPLVAGVGLTGMRERAAELGGVLTVGPRGSGSGTSLVVVLPARIRNEGNGDA